MDDNNDDNINKWQFCKALKDFKVSLPPHDIEDIYLGLVSSRQQELSIDDFMHQFIGKLDEFRRGEVERTFEILDIGDKGVIPVDTLRKSYNSRRHPDVLSGLKTIDETLGEFVGLFDAFHNSRTGHRKESITRKEFAEFFSYVSPMITSDNDFEAMVKCCRANIPTQELHPRGSEPQAEEVYASHRRSVGDNAFASRGSHQFGVIAPFGISNQAYYKTSYSSYDYPTDTQMATFNTKNKFAAGVTSWPGTHYADPRKLELEEKYQHILSTITETLSSRGIAGFLHLLETFQNTDSGCSGATNYHHFDDSNI